MVLNTVSMNTIMNNAASKYQCCSDPVPSCMVLNTVSMNTIMVRNTVSMITIINNTGSKYQ